MFAEAIGTFLLVILIFSLTEGCNVGRPSEGVSPVIIGGAVTVIISIIAPLTQAGLNPARDFGLAWWPIGPVGERLQSPVLREAFSLFTFWLR